MELTKELSNERGFKLDEIGFNQEFKKHQEKSRLSAEKRFASGLADHSIGTTKLHTATHLLHQSLRKVLGSHVQQKGSNITPERLRFDFNFNRKLTDEEKKKIEDLVNEKIQQGLEVKKQERETNQSLVRRFTKRLKQSGILMSARKGNFYKPDTSAQMKKKAALRRIEKKEEYERALKLGEK